jgi:hypothetical protein
VLAFEILAGIFLTPLALLVVAWMPLWPALALSRLPIPQEVRSGALRTILAASWRGFLVLLPSYPLVSIPVVALALLFTPRKASSLPAIFAFWDNDVSINGDDPAYWGPDYVGDAYYAPGHHPRSFIARFIWLAIRNRASRLSQMLGYTWADRLGKVTVLGTAGLNRDSEGWCINSKEEQHQLLLIKRMGPVAFRMNYGYKVNSRADGRSVANVVCIGASFLRWAGKA